MPRYEVYATRWDDPRVVEELIPTKGLTFSLPLSKHGECSFSATVEPGRSLWRPSIAPVMSGLLVERDGVPVWCGWVIGENQSGPRTFSFSAVEWGAFFSRVPAYARTYSAWNDHAIQRDLIRKAAETSGQDPKITLGSTLGAATSDLTVNPWDDRSVADLLVSLGESAGGPEWYFGAAGTHESPVRQFVQGDRLGHTSPQTVLEYVEDTEEWDAPEPPPTVALLGDLFPVGTLATLPGRRGGNVLLPARTRNSSASSTQAVAVGAGEELAQLRRTATADRLLAAGWPRLTRTERYQDVIVPGTLQRHANADLQATAGVSTGYSLVTLDGDPDWTQVPRGSSVAVSLDTDVYGGARPVEFTSRLLDLTVRVPDDGPAQIEWGVAEVMEVTL